MRAEGDATTSAASLVSHDAGVLARSLINFLMEDRFFLALYRSNDPKVRAAAMDKLNKAHHQAYGDASTKDDDAGRVE